MPDPILQFPTESCLGRAGSVFHSGIGLMALIFLGDVYLLDCFMPFVNF